MQRKFVLIGLPGVGKSTLSKECIKNLQARGIDCELLSTDTIIRQRFKATDPVIQQFEKAKNIKIPKAVFQAVKPTGAFLKYFSEEPLFRDLEEAFIKDIIRHAGKASWFDVGGKAPLRAGSVQALHAKKVIPVFIYADEKTIIARLTPNDYWSKRSNYANAGKDGWQALAHTHRVQRLGKYIDAATIIVSAELMDKHGEFTRLKTIDELTKEIFYRVKELELTCYKRVNDFTKKQKPTTGELMRNRIETKAVILSLGMLMKVDTNPFIGKMIGQAKKENADFEFTPIMQGRAFELSELFNRGLIMPEIFAKRMLELLGIKKIDSETFLNDWKTIINVDGVADNIKLLQKASAENNVLFYLVADSNIVHLAEISKRCSQQGLTVDERARPRLLEQMPVYTTCHNGMGRLDLIKKVESEIDKKRIKPVDSVTLVYGNPDNVKNPAHQAIAKKDCRAVSEWAQDADVSLVLHNNSLEQTLAHLFKPEVELAQTVKLGN